MLELDSVSKSFKNTLVLDNISLKLHPGKCLGVYGDNGQGKSTLLRILSLIYIQDSGVVNYNNSDILKITNYLSKVSFIDSQTRGLYERLTGKQNIEFLMALYNSHIDVDLMHRVAEDFAITEALEKSVSSYSLGMKQKLKILISFLRETEIILLDEFMDHLDDRSVESVCGYVREMLNKNKIALYVSKSKKSLEPVCGEIYQLKSGKLS